MQKALRNAHEQIERIDKGTDPDLPDEDLCRYLRSKHQITIDAASKVLAAYYHNEDFV